MAFFFGTLASKFLLFACTQLTHTVKNSTDLPFDLVRLLFMCTSIRSRYHATAEKSWRCFRGESPGYKALYRASAGEVHLKKVDAELEKEE